MLVLTTTEVSTTAVCREETDRDAVEEGLEDEVVAAAAEGEVEMIENFSKSRTRTILMLRAGLLAVHCSGSPKKIFWSAQ